jgi:ketosteroid isomerase-like protein
MGNRDLLKRYYTAFNDGDLDAYERFMDPDIVVRYPQSGEVFRGRENAMAVLRGYPDALPNFEPTDVEGSDHSVSVVSPIPFGLPSIAITGGDDRYVVQGLMRYVDGSLTHMVVLVEIVNDLVVAETTYFADPFDGPDWRHPFTDPE